MVNSLVHYRLADRLYPGKTFPLSRSVPAAVRLFLSLDVSLAPPSDCRDSQREPTEAGFSVHTALKRAQFPIPLQTRCCSKCYSKANLDGDPVALLGGAQESCSDRHWFQVRCCYLLPARVSDGTCFCTNTGDPGEQMVPNEARGQATVSGHQGPTASGSLNWAAAPANEKPLPSLGRSLSHRPHLEHCHKRSGKCLWLGLCPGCPRLQSTSAAGRPRQRMNRLPSLSGPGRTVSARSQQPPEKGSKPKGRSHECPERDIQPLLWAPHCAPACPGLQRGSDSVRTGRLLPPQLRVQGK